MSYAAPRPLPLVGGDPATLANFVDSNGISKSVKLAAYEDLSFELSQLPPVELTDPWFEPTLADEDLLSLPRVDIALETRAGPRSVLADILADHRHYYSVRNLSFLAAGTGVAAAMGNSNADDFISHDLYQESVRNAYTDEYFEAIHSMKIFGEGTYALPLYATAVAGGWIASQSESFSLAGNWGERSLRIILVGGPPMLAMQQVIGASRPGEAHSGSHWEPFQDDNGVSGHAFMGAVPFITAAQMTDNPWLRGGFYVGSGMAGLSRINDNHHYASQVMLGWWMAYLAAESVNRTDSDVILQPVVQTTADGFSGFSYEKRW